MPRGVAIPEVRQRLFAAAERVIARDGPAGLTGRAITREAGVATGLLYRHFADLDEFLVGYAVDRSFQISGHVATLPGRAGAGTVMANLSDAIATLPPAPVMALSRLLAADPQIVARVRGILGEAAAGLDSVEQAVAGYLTAEQRLERLPAAVDTGALAVAVTGVVARAALAGDGPSATIPSLRGLLAAVRQPDRAGDATGTAAP